MKNIIIGILSLTILMSCSKKTLVNKTVAETEQIEQVKPLPRFVTSLSSSDTMLANQDTLLFFQRAPCFGFCPSFTFTVMTNGMVVYKGYNNIEPLGTWYSLVSENWWTELLKSANTIDFFNLSDHYPIDLKENIPDLPNTNILLKEYGKRKFISDNHHCPAALKTFEIQLDIKLKELKLVDLKN